MKLQTSGLNKNYVGWLWQVDKFCRDWALIPFFLGSFTTILFNESSDWTDLVWKLVRYGSYLMIAYPVLYLGISQGMTAYRDGRLRIWALNVVRRSPLGTAAILVSALMIILARNPQAFILFLVLEYLTVTQPPMTRIAQLFFLTGTVFFLVTVVLAWSGVIENLTSIRQSDQTVRYAMGFMFPLETQGFLFFLTVSCLVAYHQRLRWPMLLVLAATNYLGFIATDARTSFILGEIAIIGAGLFSYSGFRCKVPYWLITTVVVLIFVVPVIGTYLYNSENSFWLSLNNSLTGRLEFGHRAMMQYPITLFGQPIKWIGYGNALDITQISKTYNYVDCSYIKILLESGLLFWLLLLAAYLWLLCRFSAKQWTLFGFLVLLVLGFCVLEPRLDQISMNFTLLFLYPFFFHANSKKGVVS